MARLTPISDKSAVAPEHHAVVDAVEKIFGRSKQTDRHNRRAERLKVLRQKATPEILSAREQEHAR